MSDLPELLPKHQKIVLTVLKFILTTLLILFLTIPLRAEWSWGIFSGKAFTSNSDLKIVQPSKGNNLLFKDVKYKDRSFETPLYYGIRLGYFLSSRPHFGWEAEFIHAKIYSDADQVVKVSGTKNGQLFDQTTHLGDMVQNFSISHGLNFLFFNLVGRYVLLKKGPEDKVQILGRIGIGPIIPHVESTIDGISKEQFEIQGPAFQAALGTQIHLWRGLSWLLEYKFTYANIKNAKIPSGTAQTKTQTNHLTFGLGGKF